MHDEYYHKPVMCAELLKYLNLRKDGTVLDCTVGSGGHADMILKEIASGGRLIGLDQDEQALEVAQNRLKGFSNYVLVRGNFKDLDLVLSRLNVEQVDGIIFDLGISSLQLDQPNRGFSFRFDSPLDMRMDSSLKISAFDLVNFLPQESLAQILQKYGQERWHNRIARAIVRERKKSMIVSTKQLADLVGRVLPYRHSKIHPATRTFQALRIAVNDELEALRVALTKSIVYLKPGARICVISFHSLEDRIVKNKFRDFAKEGRCKLITKKPIRPSEDEVLNNPRARSGRLRVAEKIN